MKYQLAPENYPHRCEYGECQDEPIGVVRMGNAQPYVEDGRLKGLALCTEHVAEALRADWVVYPMPKKVTKEPDVVVQERPQRRAPNL